MRKSPQQRRRPSKEQWKERKRVRMRMWGPTVDDLLLADLQRGVRRHVDREEALCAHTENGGTRLINTKGVPTRGTQEQQDADAQACTRERSPLRRKHCTAAARNDNERWATEEPARTHRVGDGQRFVARVGQRVDRELGRPMHTHAARSSNQ
jgi:hypothetical protein